MRDDDPFLFDEQFQKLPPILKTRERRLKTLMTINQFFNRHTKILIFQKRIICLIPVGRSKTRETKS